MSSYKYNDEKYKLSLIYAHDWFDPFQAKMCEGVIECCSFGISDKWFPLNFSGKYLGFLGQTFKQSFYQGIGYGQVFSATAPRTKMECLSSMMKALAWQPNFKILGKALLCKCSNALVICTQKVKTGGITK